MDQLPILTPRQARFVDEYVVCGNAAESARKAGYSERSAKVTACRMLTNANLQTVIAAKQAALATRIELKREHVVAGILEGIGDARERHEASTMIRGWVELAKMCGLYGQGGQGVTETVDGKSNFRFMPTAELMRKIADGGVLRNADGSAMRPEQVDAFYQSLETDELVALAEGRARIEMRVVMKDKELG